MRFIFLLLPLFIFADITLSKKEKNFIDTHTVKCITTTKWAPFNTLVNGKLEGIAIDYWKLISKKLHLKYKCEINDDWGLILQKIKEKKADVTPSTTKTPLKSEYAIFSIPYATFPFVIATKNSVGYIGSLAFLKDKKIVVGKNYTISYLLKRYYPGFHIIEAENIKKALEMVSNGKAYAAIDILPVIIYHINKYQFANLKISGNTPWEFKMQFMIRKDYKELQSAINKAIDSITPQEKKAIYHKWVNVTYQRGYTLKEILAVIAITVIIILALLYKVYGLQKEIKRRTVLENQLKKLSILDTLTGIFNRYKIDLALTQHISFAKRHMSPLSVIFFEVNEYEEIKQKFGKDVSDDILRNMTIAIKDQLREYDIFGRWAGEEFIIILPNTSLYQATRVAEKLKKAIKKQTHKKVGKISCSFGITELREEDDCDSILIRVDKLMFKAKQKGKNLYVAE